MQLALVGDTLAPPAVTLNVPDGVLGPEFPSVTVTVQLLACPTSVGLTQLTSVVLERRTAIVADPELTA
jgi:hypothetical protein